MSTVVAGAGLLAVLSTTPAVAGGTPAMVTPGGGCTAAVVVDSEWGSGPTGGQVLRFTVTNTSAAQSTAWTVTWTLGAGQRVSTQWNTALTTAGSTVTAKNAAYNGKLASGAATSFGVMVAGVAAAPTLTCDNGTGTPAADVSVGESDDGRSVSLRVGQTLAVSLGSDYAAPTLAGTGLTAVSSTGGYPTGAPLAAVYRAAVAGTVDLSARTSAGTVWTVHVTVAGPAQTGSGQSYTVTEADNQRTLHVAVGDIIVVSLDDSYQPPTVTTAGVLTLGTISGGYPTDESLVARYLVSGSGTTDIKTRTDIECFHQPTPCPSPSIPWTLHVSVDGPSSTAGGQTYTVSQSDNLNTKRVWVGDVVVVNLPANYQPPTVTPDGILTLSAISGGYPTNQPLVARYLVSGRGTATIKTRTDIACFHQPTPCPSPSIPWTLSVTAG